MNASAKSLSTLSKDSYVFSDKSPAILILENSIILAKRIKSASTHGTQSIQTCDFSKGVLTSEQQPTIATADTTPQNPQHGVPKLDVETYDSSIPLEQPPFRHLRGLMQGLFKFSKTLKESQLCFPTIGHQPDWVLLSAS